MVVTNEEQLIELCCRKPPGGANIDALCVILLD